jgi:hypothetical protein
MYVEIIATGEKLHMVDSEALQALIKLGQIKPIERQAVATPGTPAAPKFQPYVAPLTISTWGIAEEYATGQMVVTWSCPHCKQGGRAVGVRQDAIDKIRAWHCGHPGGEPVSEAVQERYRALPEHKVACPIVCEAANPAENIRQAEDIARRKDKEGVS